MTAVTVTPSLLSSTGSPLNCFETPSGRYDARGPVSSAGSVPTVFPKAVPVNAVIRLIPLIRTIRSHLRQWCKPERLFLVSDASLIGR